MALWKIFYLVCKIWRNLHNNYDISPVMSCKSSNKCHQNKAENLFGTLSFCFLYNVYSVMNSRGTRKSGPLVPESNTYESWYYAVSETHLRIWCYLFNVLFIKKILKNIPSKIPDIVIDSYLFEDCTLIIYPVLH